MKIRYMSDLHLTHGEFEIPESPEDTETTLILAGDVHVGVRFLPFVEKACEQFKFVLMVFGNHEFYCGSVPELRAEVSGLKTPNNFYLLDNDTIVLDGITFIGSTLWTDLCFGSVGAKLAASTLLNDYRHIHKGAGHLQTITPECTMAFHDAARIFIEKELKKVVLGRTVVITHHLPVKGCVAEKYRASGDLNWSFACLDMDAILEATPPAFWIHGHSHDTTDLTTEAGTRILCNPKGYGKENAQGFNVGAYFNIGE